MSGRSVKGRSVRLFGGLLTLAFPCLPRRPRSVLTRATPTPCCVSVASMVQQVGVDDRLNMCRVRQQSDMGTDDRGGVAAEGQSGNPPGMPTCEALVAFEKACRAKGLRPKTIRWYLEMLTPLRRRFEVVPTEPGDIEDVLGNLGVRVAQVEDVTRVDHWVAMRVFYGFLERRHGHPNPMSHVEKPRKRRKVMEALTEPQLLRVLGEARSGRDKALLTLLADTGMRLGEAHSLTWAHVGTDVVQVEGKTGRREVPISDWSRWTIMGVELPWRGARGVMTVEGLGRVVRRCMRRAGVEAGGAHVLRHTFARLYLRAGGDVITLQRILGHASITTTRGYLDLEMGDVVLQHRRFSPIVRLLETASRSDGLLIANQDGPA